MKIINYGLELNDSRPQLIKEKEVNWNERENLSIPANIVAMLNNVFRLNKKAEEYLYMVCLDAKCCPVGVFEISHGLVNSSLVSPREVMIRALMCGAVSFVLIHNHPSGDIAPSSSDMITAENMRKAGVLMNIRLADFIIVGGDDFYSFTQAGI